MTIEILSSLSLFALVSSITPGPNNLMLMTSGMKFGFRRTIPHMLGVGIGFSLMIVLVGIGLMQLFDLYPVTYQILRVGSVVYLLYLAFKIAMASSPFQSGTQNEKPMTFFQAALFQWVNPKAWTMALTSISVYSPQHTLISILLIASIFGSINLPSVGLWALLGQKLRRFLTDALVWRTFNVVMALLLVGSLYFAFSGQG